MRLPLLHAGFMCKTLYLIDKIDGKIIAVANFNELKVNCLGDYTK